MIGVPRIVMGGRSFSVIVLNVQVPSEEKSDVSKDSFTRN